MRLCRIFSPAFLLLFLLIPTSGRTDSFTPLKVISRMHQTYQKIDGLQAKFIQNNLNPHARYQQTFKGKLYLKKPSLIRMEVDSPQEQQIIINEKEVWIYIPEDNQAIVSASSPDLRMIFAFLLGGENLIERYQIKWAEPDQVEKNENFLLQVEEKATPKTKFEKIILTIRKKDFNIIKIMMFDLTGGGIQLELIKIKVNNSLNKSLFVFKPPPGVKIERAGNQDS